MTVRLLAAAAGLALLVGGWLVVSRARESRAEAVAPDVNGAVAGGGGSEASVGGDRPDVVPSPTNDPGRDHSDPPLGRQPLSEAERQAREREKGRWLEELRGKGSDWLHREAGRLSMSADQRSSIQAILDELLAELDKIRRGRGERDVEQLVYDLYARLDARASELLTEAQREIFGGFPRSWGDNLTGR